MKITVSRRGFLQGFAAAVVVGPAFGSADLAAIANHAQVHVLDGEGNVLAVTSDVTWSESFDTYVFNVGPMVARQTGMAERVRIIWDGLELTAELTIKQPMVVASDLKLSDFDMRIA